MRKGLHMKTQFVRLSLCILAVFTLMIPPVYAAEGERYEELVIQNDVVIFSEEDADRYIETYEYVMSLHGDEYVEMISWLFERTAEDDQLAIQQNYLIGNMYHSLPNKDEKSQEEALCIAYAYLEKNDLLSPGELKLFVPRVAFFAFLDDPVNRLWQFHFVQLDRKDDEPLINFAIWIHATEGTVIRFSDQDDAVG